MIHASITIVWLVPLGFAQEPALDFEKDVRPIFAANCYRCHGAQKQKSGLRFDTKEGILSEDYLLVPGKPEESEIYVRVSVPRDDEDRMPPEGEGEPLTPEEIARIGKWIEGGAGFGSWTKDEAEGKSLPKVPPAPPEALDALRKAGAMVETLARNTNLLRVDFRPLGTDAGDEQLALLEGVKEQVAWLSLRGTAVTDAGLERLRDLINLRRLDLTGTAVTDAGLKQLAELSELQTVILNNTRVTDAGLKNLHGLSNLRRLYVWRTGVTPEGADALTAKVEEVEVIMGVDAGG